MTKTTKTSTVVCADDEHDDNNDGHDDDDADNDVDKKGVSFGAKCVDSSVSFRDRAIQISNSFEA